MHRFWSRLTEWSGSTTAVILSFVTVGVWAVWVAFTTGNFLDPVSQLPVNSFTTIVTYWLCFIILNSQNRSDRALHTKIDTLLEAIKQIHDERLVGLEDESEKDIKRLQEQVRQSKGQNVES